MCMTEFWYEREVQDTTQFMTMLSMLHRWTASHWSDLSDPVLINRRCLSKIFLIWEYFWILLMLPTWWFELKRNAKNILWLQIFSYSFQVHLFVERLLDSQNIPYRTLLIVTIPMGWILGGSISSVTTAVLKQNKN